MTPLSNSMGPSFTSSSSSSSYGTFPSKKTPRGDNPRIGRISYDQLLKAIQNFSCTLSISDLMPHPLPKEPNELKNRLEKITGDIKKDFFRKSFEVVIDGKIYQSAERGLEALKKTLADAPELLDWCHQGTCAPVTVTVAKLTQMVNFFLENVPLAYNPDGSCKIAEEGDRIIQDPTYMILEHRLDDHPIQIFIDKMKKTVLVELFFAVSSTNSINPNPPSKPDYLFLIFSQSTIDLEKQEINIQFELDRIHLQGTVFTPSGFLPFAAQLL